MISGKIENFRIATGVVAIAVAVYAFLDMLLWLNAAVAGQVMRIGGVYFRVATVAAMTLCAIFAFAFYGKKKIPLMGTSSLLIAIGYGSVPIAWIAIALQYGGVTVSMNTILSHSFVVIIALVLFCNACLNFGLLKKFSKVNFIVILPLVALCFAFIWAILLPLLTPSGQFNFALAAHDVLPVVPFVLFALFCPPHYVRFTKPSLEKKISTGDLTAQLQQLKHEFDTGIISEHEYEIKRKYLVEGL